jgi:hypothetical protein
MGADFSMNEQPSRKNYFVLNYFVAIVSPFHVLWVMILPIPSE